MNYRRTMVTGIAVMIGFVTAGNNTRIFAQVPRLLNYQGKLTDPDGNSVLDGEYEMRFSLYDAASDGTLVWGPEEWSVSTQRVTVNDGLFNVLLGTHEPLSTTAFDVPYWLQVEVFNTDPLVNAWESFTPRRQLASAPYALRAGNVAGGMDIQVNTLFTTGSVGIGTTTPVHSLEVVGNVEADGFTINGVPVSTSSDTYWSSATGGISYSGGKVGIGTTTPGTLLEIAAPSSELPTVILGRNTGNPSVRGTSDLILDGDAADGLVYLNYYSTGDVVLAQGGGKVGIGTTTPSDTLHVSGGILRISRGGDASHRGEISYVVNEAGTGNDGLIINSDTGGTWSDIHFRTRGTTKMFIESGGKVGIGTTDPQNNLDIAGNISIGTGYNASSITFNDDNGLNYSITNGNVANNILSINADGQSRIAINGSGNVGIGTTSPSGKLEVRTSGGGRAIWGTSSDGDRLGGIYQESDTRGTISLYNASDTQRVRLETNGDSYFTGGNLGIGTYNPSKKLHVAGDIQCDVVYIMGGSDIAEPFDVESIEEVKPGMVLVIDEERPGKLKVSSKAYDSCVAGIVSGAGGVKPGMMLSQEGTVADGKYPVALTGRAYVLADTSNGRIKPGDMLTTSSKPGYAMKVTDHLKAHGAILGKAMSLLEQGDGLVLTLITQQ